jgi:hypothetical protein
MRILFSLLAATSLAVPDARAQTQDHSHCAGVIERGDHVMGFDHSRTSHHFRLTRSGGVIEAAALDPADTESRDQIRVHFRHIAMMFAQGNFEAPMLIHDRVPPGVPEMKKLKPEIRYQAEETAAGGRVVITTKNARALAAIHAFLEFQIRDHQTGDPLEISPEKS